MAAEWLPSAPCWLITLDAGEPLGIAVHLDAETFKIGLQLQRRRLTISK
jgi:hypothetical protein